MLCTHNVSSEFFVYGIAENQCVEVFWVFQCRWKITKSKAF